MMDEWKQLISVGNKYFSSENYVSALSVYQRSLNCIVADFPKFIRHDPHSAISALLVSHFNLAEAFQRDKRLDEASQQFSAAFYFMKRLLDVCSRGSEASEALLRGCQELQFEWTFFISNNAKRLAALRLQEFATAKTSLGDLFGGQMALH
jgi:hypothetical protein